MAKLKDNDSIVPVVESKPEKLSDKELKFKVDPNEVKARAYADEDFKGFVEEFKKQLEIKPTILKINTTTLEKLGYRDLAVGLGLTVVEGVGYEPDELILSVV